MLNVTHLKEVSNYFRTYVLYYDKNDTKISSQ